ncbi:MAG: hypothetical protein IPF51_16190 [Dehalococcoidia bacterium]|uniref:hypothetical protein n=1 Tax=Candidatus Amarobacter glycogenicus TaxID=3140699 RepID=UPI0031374D59|nr:hypothetical protein [Dehalococcoidia bacterium]
MSARARPFHHEAIDFDRRREPHRQGMVRSDEQELRALEALPCGHELPRVELQGHFLAAAFNVHPVARRFVARNSRGRPGPGGIPAPTST